MRHLTSDVVTDGERRGADEEGVLTLAQCVGFSPGEQLATGVDGQKKTDFGADDRDSR
jgi:hypothetical protein